MNTIARTLALVCLTILTFAAQAEDSVKAVTTANRLPDSVSQAMAPPVAQDTSVGCTTCALSAKVEVHNPSRSINDGVAEVIVKNGTPPFKYIWPQAGTSTESSTTTGVIEGMLESVTIVDAKNDTLKLSYEVPMGSLSEHINTFFHPIVSTIGSVLFYDPFAALGLRDPVIRNEDGTAVLNANGTERTQSIPVVVVWLVLGGLFFTLRFKFINIWGFKHAIQLVRGDYDDPEDAGEVSHFQALTTALSATVGLGNIAGVAVAISLGGAGATFWMILAGLMGMSLKFTECTLGVKYRKIDEKGEVHGGPMHYLSTALDKRGWGSLGKILAFIFAALCIGGSFGGGNMFQANQAFAQVKGALPFLQGNGAYFGIFLAVLVGVVIIGGIKSIAKVTDKIVPFMVGLYVIVALIIIGMNISHIGLAFQEIFYGAFTPGALKGGVVGVLIVGFQRAAFSNEAGVGSASIAHSAAKTDEPVSEGVVALLEPFIDTVVVCTMTALVLIFTGYDQDTSGLGGSELTSAAFSSVFWWFQYALTIAIVLFAFSTMISWSYYGLRCWNYLFGNSKFATISYKMLFLVFTVVGSATGLGAVLDFSDMMILGMAFPNILGLLILHGEVVEDVKNYFSKLKSGEIQKYSKEA